MPSAILQRKREERTIVQPHRFGDLYPLPANTPVGENELSTQPSPDLFEASLHRMPRTLQSEVGLVFPDIARQAKKEARASRNNGQRETGRQYLLIPTFHVARFSILERNDRTEAERIRIFLRFRTFAEKFKRLLLSKDSESQVDIPDIDGVSAFSTSGSTATAYDEVASTRAVLGYSTFLYMGIQIVKHPRIGYEKLAIHTMILFARPEDAESTYYETFKDIHRYYE